MTAKWPPKTTWSGDRSCSILFLAVIWMTGACSQSGPAQAGVDAIDLAVSDETTDSGDVVNVDVVVTDVADGSDAQDASTGPYAWLAGRTFSDSCAIVEGKLFCWGYGGWGENGDGGFGLDRYPVAVLNIDSPLEVREGSYFRCALQEGGDVFCWGKGDKGQLGVMGLAATAIPVKAPGLPPMRTICCGSSHACGIDENGGTWCWGATGPAGHDIDGAWEASLPGPVDGLPFAMALECGDGHTCILSEEGGVWCWGHNQYLQASPGVDEEWIAPTVVGGLPACRFIRSRTAATCCGGTDEKVYCWGGFFPGYKGSSGLPPTEVPEFEGCVDVAGEGRLCSLSEAGAIACVEKPNDESAEYSVVMVELGEPVDALSGNAALTQSGVHLRRHTETPGNGSCAIAFEAVPIQIDSAVIDLSVAPQGTVVASADGVTFWGMNPTEYAPDTDGQMRGEFGGSLSVSVVQTCLEEDNPSTTSRFVCLLSAEGSVYCAGDNKSGELGQGNKLPAKEFVVVPLDSPALTLSCSSGLVCAYLGAKTVACWGTGGKGVVLNGEEEADYLSPTYFDLPFVPSMLKVGNFLSDACALDEEGGMWCWGGSFPFPNLDDHVLGDPYGPTLLPFPSPVIDFDAGVLHACALTADSDLYCWGDNGFGQLEPDEGEWPPYETDYPYWKMHKVGPSYGLQMTSVACGFSHTCVGLEGGGVQCWGQNTGPWEGILGDGGPDYTDGQDEEPKSASVKGFEAEVARLSLGETHSCALTTTGQAFCWGMNLKSECGWQSRWWDEFASVIFPAQ